MLENRPFHIQAAAGIRNALKETHGYLAYKLTTLGRASDDEVPSFLIVTQELGILLLDIIEERVEETVPSDELIYWKVDPGPSIVSRDLILEIYEDEVESRLKNDLSLYDRKTKRPKIPVASVVVFCRNTSAEIEQIVDLDSSRCSAITIDDLGTWLAEKTAVPAYAGTEESVGRILSLLEGTFVYETKRGPLHDEPLITVNDYIQRSLQTTFQQDDAQRLASLQLPPGPQRIRGLAGTGKTIVLSIKAAITHKRFPQYKILYLFNTQSLYQHVQGLIAKYYTLEAKRTPDFDDHLHVFHAWGGRQRPGLYSTLCQKYGLRPLTLSDVRGASDSLAFIYKDLLSKAKKAIKAEYDLVLIDEAQDFPKEVFEVAYLLAKGVGADKRIIWAYDEFQSLRDTQIKEPDELFGVNAKGEPNLPKAILSGAYAGGIPKDFVLPNCYRTPRPVLMTAHGVAMGLYSGKPTEMFYYPDEWGAIGYKVNQPRKLSIAAGDHVEIERPDENSKNLLESLLRGNGKSARHLVQIEECADADDQLAFVANKIQELISEQGVAPEEIIAINLRSGNNKEEMLQIQRSLTGVGVKSVLPGYVESSDIFKPKGFVTITTPFRAKGNEANIVFVLNAQSVASDFTLRMRNAFFVAVTRSRGWCYISGYGKGIPRLAEEIDGLKKDLPLFRFVCPDPSEVQSSKSFLQKSDKELDEIAKLLELYDKNPEIRRLIQERERGGGE
ncbi:Superfamily I DNA and RNA helicases [Variovorax sp. HW608]|uniref:DEAD/DEAH box helicase n=1 Tax=Variovorax sp. HW608 TaxID=1034889 RepID=UPI00081FC2D0|nr:ATP-binding domain-containing protein [Variovorax sp. HW608]SCK49139.1 Superfamily I DNA and RNA helicases [Variovorax sp. HW608]